MIQERAAEANKAAEDGVGRIWLPSTWERSVAWPRSHGKTKGHPRHHAWQGAYSDGTDYVDNSSGSALASHRVHEGVAHGARRYED